MGIRTLSINLSNRTSIHLAGRLTCICPVSGKRDFATVEVSYHPTATVVELESFAAYLASFANEQIGHEDVTESIRDEIAETTLSDDITVRSRWEPVEGVECVVTAT